MSEANLFEPDSPAACGNSQIKIINKNHFKAMSKIGKRIGKVAICRLPKNAPQILLVDQNAGYTPAQMRELYEQGLAVGQQNAGVYTQSSSTKNPSWDIPIEERRGVDPADLWEIQTLSRRKVANAHVQDVRKYGRD